MPDMGTTPPRGQPAVPTAVDERPLAAFDFDGTLTSRDSFTAFLRWRAGAVGYAAGVLRLAPALAAYLVHRDRGRLKAAAVRLFLRGVPRAALQAEARRFADEAHDALLRPDALAEWERRRRQDCRMVIVTASPEDVVRPFAERLGAELIGTRLAFDDADLATGAFVGANCRGPEKVARLSALFGAEARLLAAYGDTGGDREMLAIAAEPGYRVFTQAPLRGRRP